MRIEDLVDCFGEKNRPQLERMMLNYENFLRDKFPDEYDALTTAERDDLFDRIFMMGLRAQKEFVIN